MRKLAAAIILSGASALAGQCRDFAAQEAVQLGVQHYKASKYAEAARDFERAVAADPRCVLAKTYLATALAQQYIPGVSSPENTAMAEKAIEQFQRVLDDDPRNTNSVAAIASMYFQLKKLDESAMWYQKRIALEPTNAEAYYALGVIGWTKAYPARMKVKAEHNIPPDQPMDDWIREPLCRKNLPIVEDAMANLEKAMALRSDYDDAMAYMNLMFREKADCQADSSERAKLLRTADEWVEKVMAARRKKAEAADGNIPRQ